VDRERICQRDFVEVAGRLSQAWVQSPVETVILWTDGPKWVNGRGHILCLDEATRKWVKSQLNTSTIDSRMFRGWDKDEYSDMTPASVLLADSFAKCSPYEIISRSLKDLKLTGDVVVKSIIPTNGNGRIVKLMLHTGLAEAVAKLDSRIPAGLHQLVFKFKTNATEDPEEQVALASSSTKKIGVSTGSKKFGVSSLSNSEENMDTNNEVNTNGPGGSKLSTLNE
jgi:hypothetical protein